MAGDLKRLGERIADLRGQTPAAVVARRAGCSAAYLHQIEKAKPDKKSKRPIRPSIAMIRSIAFALPGAVTSELLELAGYEEDIIAYDRMRERRAALPVTPPGPATLTSAAVVEELRRLLALVEDSEEQPGDRAGASGRWLQPARPGTAHTGNQGTAELG